MVDKTRINPCDQTHDLKPWDLRVMSKINFFNRRRNITSQLLGESGAVSQQQEHTTHAIP
jgi:hypothetical protein